MNKESQKFLEYTQQQVVSQVAKHLDSYFHSTMNITNTLYSQSINKWDLTENYDDMLADFNKQKMLNQEYLTSISLFDRYGNLIVSTNGDEIRSSYDVATQSWFYQAISNVENGHFNPPFVENLFKNQEEEFPWVFSLSQAVIYRDQHLTKQGVLLINMNRSKIEQICKNVDLNGSGYLFLMDKEGHIIYHPQENLLNSDLANENIEKIVTYPESVVDEKYGNEPRVVIKKMLGYTGWNLIGISPKQVSPSLYKNQMVWLLCLVSIILLLMVNYVLSKLVTKPIADLELAVEKIEKDIDDVDFKIKGTSEIRHLSGTLHSMALNIQELMKVSIRNEQKKRKSEMAVLQAQINPHFLYNTLDSVIWMIENHKYQEAINMIMALAKLFRISLNKGKDIVTIEQELTHVDNYLKIQSIRYKQRFSYQITIDPVIAEFGVIKLILQPLVENAIYHGIEPSYDDCLIDIKVHQLEDAIVFEVKDDGVGMSAEQVEQLKSGQISSKKGSSFGYKNVFERLYLTYGEQATMTIDSELDEGTNIMIKIPKYTVEELEEKDELT
ncbi:sensor histidine kinase [Vagococcus zengguangii]|uniref:sensor histidine kinase n=1 Tax=Vagococcus zengguangii TaxID=2571750 RepID=UPI0014855384|nr:sensor histidine kinase [Vagococcus zengguangii]